MFDTLHIELPNQYIEGLGNKSDTIDSETGEVKYSVGYFDCIKIRKVRDVIMVECSLPRLLKGNNIYSLSFLEVKSALWMIEKKLGISIQKGIIRRLDGEFTFETKQKPTVYFRYLGDSRYYNRTTIQNTSLYYSNKSRVVNFYDKIKEIKSKRGIIPSEFIDKNILRFECRYRNVFLKKIAKEYGYDTFRIENLIDENIYTKLAGMFLKEYKSIFKIDKPVMNFDKIVSKKSFMEQLANRGIDALGGVNEVLDMIDASRPFNTKIRKEYFCRRKNEIKDLASCTVMTTTSNCINELDKKIEKTYFSALESLPNSK